VVIGAYKAIAIRHLETEALYPLLDLYLNKRVADFEAYLYKSRKDYLIQRYYKSAEVFIRYTGQRCL
jgi:hypothetical protein